MPTLRWGPVGGEDHRHKPWGDESDRADACHCGDAGMLCRRCNQTPGRESDLPPGCQTIIDGDGPRH
jgi:hypothetical protein